MSPKTQLTRAEKYGRCGATLAHTANYLGADISPEETERWHDIMARLSEADDIFERDPSQFTDPRAALEFLGISSADSNSIKAMRHLLEADYANLRTDDINDHFGFGDRAGRAVMDLLLYQTSEDTQKIRDVRRQLGNVSVAGFSLDALFDAKEDSELMPQFSAFSLAMGGMKEFIKSVRAVKISTWFALSRALQKEHVYGFVFGQMAKTVLGLNRQK